MKTFLIVFGVIITVSLAFVMYVRMTTKAVIYSGLSDRGKEYLKLKYDANDREWQNVTLNKPVNPDNVPTVKTVDDQKCFSLKVPIPASEVRREAECQYRFFLTDPVGDVVVFRRAVEVAAIDDVADISMRRVYSDQYSEKQKNINGRTFLIFKTKGDRYESSAFFLNNKQLFVFSLVVHTNENLDKQFEEALESVKIYNEE